MADTGFGLALGGGGGKSSVRRIITPEGSPFANAAALNTWVLEDIAKADDDRELRDTIGDNALVTVVVVLDNTGFSDLTGNTYQWNGGDLPTTYDIDDWLIYKGIGAEAVKDLLESNSDTNTVSDDVSNLINSLIDIPDGNIPYLTGGVAVESPYRVTSSGESFITGTPRIETGSLNIGTVTTLSDNGGFVGLSNALSGTKYRLIDFSTPTHNASNRIRRLANIEAENSLDIISGSSLVSSPADFQYTTNVLATTNKLKIDIAEAVTGLRMKISNVTPNTNGTVIKYWPSEAAWVDGVGEDFDVGEQVLDFTKSPILFEEGRTIRIEAVYDTGKILGDASGRIKTTVVLQRGRYIETQDALDDIDAVISSSDYQTLPNQSISIDLQSNGSVLLPVDSSCVDGDLLRIQEIEFNGGTVLSIKNADNSLLNVRTADGSHLTDTSLATDKSIELDFKYKNNGWWLYL